MENKRVLWLDVAKFFGIFAIYLGHFSETSGHAFSFVFTYHVPLFFLLAGAAETFNKDKTFIKYLKKKFINIIIPYIVFGIIILIMISISSNLPLGDVPQLLEAFTKGAIRNDIFSGTLWFLTCLFTMSIIFYFIKKMKNKIFIVAICFVLYVIEVKFIHLYPIAYNINNALYYIFYYAIGYATFSIINNLLTSNKRNL